MRAWNRDLTPTPQPSRFRRRAALALVASALGAGFWEPPAFRPGGTWAAQQQPRFDERVDVTRVLVDVRVIARAGEAVRDLRPEEFRVTGAGTWDLAGAWSPEPGAYLPSLS